MTFVCKLVILFSFIGLCWCQSSPLIHDFPPRKTVSEDLQNGTVLFNFTATHPENKDITVHAEGVMTNNMVYVNQTTGSNIFVQVITKCVLDHDGDGRGYPGSDRTSLTFRVTDTNGNEINLRMNLYINDVNDNSPILMNRPYFWEIPELHFCGNGTNNQAYNKVTADDYDSGQYGNQSIRYYMEPLTQSSTTDSEYRDTFAMAERTGVVTLKKQLDYETNSYYQFNVTAIDKQGQGNTGIPADLIIRVLDVQDTPPFFIGQPYRGKIQENVSLNTSVETVKARDGDTGVSNPVNYTILPGICSSLFKISADGVITTAAAIDRDSGEVNDVDGVCVLKVLVQEEDRNAAEQCGITNATTEVTITIEDIDDNSPEFENTTYMAEVQENTPPNVPITLIDPKEITVYDKDQGNNAKIGLSLQYPNGIPCDDFIISPVTVQKSGSALIKVKNQELLDFETIKNLTFLILAKESNHTATATVSLSIKDMNDNNPQFENSSYSFSVKENSENFTSIGTITATDKDSGAWGNITYSISGGNKRFTVDEYTGDIYTSCTDCSVDLDRERVDVYYMTYTATDLGGRSNSTSLIIHITDENDNTPTFTRQTYSAFITENDERYNATPVVQVEADDRDEKETNNSMIIYQLLSFSEDVSGNVSMNNTTGELYLNHSIDFEKLKNKSGIIEITVEARDLGEPSKASNATVVITVQDENDNEPIFSECIFNESVAENATSNATSKTSIGNLSATDADGKAPNNKIQYFIISGAMDHFTVNPDSGEINVQINAHLNREEISFYNITVAAIDQGSSPKTGSAVLIINIDDVNDEYPKFNMTEYGESVLENDSKLVGTTIITCLATDEDLNAYLSYSIVEVSAKDESGIVVNQTLVKDYFGIHDENGSVYIKTTPDREIAKTIYLTIQVEDLNAYLPVPQKANVSLTITLLDDNDNPPEFTEQLYNVSVSENAQNPTILLTISATDRDENRTIRYGIIKTSNESDSFSIDPVSGVLRKTGPLDREETSKIILKIKAEDNGVPPLNSTTDVSVNVLDFNDNAPEFENFTSEIVIPENAAIGYFVLKISASDADIGPNANVTYSIEEGDDEKFAVDPLNGSVTVSKDLDRETKAVYMLRIKAQDNPLNIKEQKSTEKTLTISLSDINDNEPQFESTYYSARVLENGDVGNSILQVQAHDSDASDTNNSLIFYSFSNDTTPPGLFRIDARSGVVHVNASLVGHVGSYVLGLIAEDQGEPKLNSSAVVNITVLDVNLNPPYITNLPNNSKLGVYECVKVGSAIYRFNYSDDDKGINADAYFNISELDDQIFDTFFLDPNGTLVVKKGLDAVNKTSYRFQVQVTDKGTPPLSSDKVTLTIEVRDVNDNLPSFGADPEKFTVKENQPVGTLVGAVIAEDPDLNSVACYFIEGDSYNKFFDIGKNNGSIVTKMKLDYEEQNEYKFSVGVKDCSLVVNISECGDIDDSKDPNYRDKINVTVHVIDVNDNPPVFKLDEITVGMRRKTEVNEPLDISLKTSDYIEDEDTEENGRQAWVFTNAGNIQTSASLSGKIGPMDGVMNCSSDKKRHIVCVTGNGSLINNKYYSEDISGYFILPVNVSDSAGSDSINIKIFLIGDSQILIMTVYGPKEDIAEKKNEILAIYSKITGHTFVYDWLEDHKTTDGRVETFKTDIYFHVVDSKTERTLSASEALRVVDQNYERLLQAMQQFQVLEIVPSVKEIAEEDNSIKTIYILAAVIAVLVVTVAIVIYVSITTRNAYKRKLKAATVKPLDAPVVTEKDSTGIPGSNVFSQQTNPILNAEIPDKIEYDNLSMGSNDSLDSNSVGEPRKESDYDQIEEKEVRMDIYLEENNDSFKMECLLDAALKQYDKQNLQNKQDNSSTDGIVSPRDIDALAFENTAYVGEFESTEI